MLKRERQAYILHQVALHNRVLCTNLCQDMGVSDDTIRRDLQDLADEGQIIKVHGGALSNTFHKAPLTNEGVYAHRSKAIIAQKAATLITDGMHILTGGGTTIVELAKALSPTVQATFVSPSLSALVQYTQHPMLEVIALGGKVSKSSNMCVGAEVITAIGAMRADLCLLGINAIDEHFGVSDNDWEVVQVKKAMVAASRKLVCLTISEKIDTFQPIHICNLGQISTLVTELDPDDPKLDRYKEAGIHVL